MVSKTGVTLTWLKSQTTTKPTYPTVPFTGQTIIVTGSNTGMGLEAARHFVRLGAARVILAVRDVAKGERARADIERNANPPSSSSVAAPASTARSPGGGGYKPAGVVEVWELDLGRYASVVAFGERVGRELDRLDVVVENAAKFTYAFSRDAEGHESTVTVNVTSTMLLALLVLPKLRETAARLDKECVLTFTGSFTHHMVAFAERHTAPGQTIFEALDDEKTAKMNSRYYLTKLMQLQLTRELASRVSASMQPGSDRVTINTTNPSFVATDIMREVSGVGKKLLGGLKWAMARTPEVGGRTLVLAAYGGRDTHGGYLDDGKKSE
jgi:NAD(P)-dependent dehydrogenase (short-subunit alcohol dehydrogenase family)